jgi:hypothetical protein
MLRGDVVERPPITQEGLGRPTACGFDNVWGSTRHQQLGRPSNTKTVASRARVAQGLPNSVASPEEGGLGEGDEAVCRGI